MKDQTLHLVYVTDAGYLMPTTVSLLSAYAWCSEPSQLITHVIDIGISDSAWTAWEKRISPLLPSGARIVRHKLPENALDGLPEYRGNAATCARAYIPALLPDEDWCLYVDGDTMFFDDPLKLRDIFDPAYAFQAHRDRLDTPKDVDSKRVWFEARGFDWDVDQYGCAGVLLINLIWFRQHTVGEKLLAFMRKYPESGWPDQDALYAVCLGHIKFLPDEWGMMDDHLWLSKGTVPSCLHYVGNKPWELTPIRMLGRCPISLQWLKTARVLTGWPVGELVTKNKPRSVRFCNLLGWFWKCVFRLAALSGGWKTTHIYRLWHYPPRFLMQHISAERLCRTLGRVVP